MATDLAHAYRACARTTRRNAPNFFFAFLSLPRAQRRAVYALYAFCHEADCIADAGMTTGIPAVTGENGAIVLASGEPSDVRSSGREDHRASQNLDDTRLDDLEVRRAGLRAMRERLARAARGRPETERDLALAATIARYGVREEDLRDVLIGVEMDLGLSRVETYAELRTYCYHVASAVGLATLPILTGGVSPTEAMREAAIDLGLGMQYVNILRDVDEDLALGRIYLPSEELATHGVDEAQLRARTMPGELRTLLAKHADRAGAHLSSGRRLLPQLPRRSRACPWLLSEIYRRILTRIAETGYRVFEERVSLPAIEKMWLLLSSTWRRV